MPTVWMRVDAKRRTRFHRSPECRQLRKGPARGPGLPLVAIELSETGVRPCKTCYPDAPTIRLLKRYCYECDTGNPCAHNGGVLIKRRGHGFPQYVWSDSNQMPYFRSA
jgi:hypothetical protein